MEQILKRMDFLIRHYDESDVMDWIVLKHDLMSWKKEQRDYRKYAYKCERELEQRKRDLFDLLMIYDPQLIVRELSLSGVEFLQRKKDNQWNRDEIDKAIREVIDEQDA